MDHGIGQRVYRRAGAGLFVAVRLTPKSSQDAIDGLERRGGLTAVKARVRAVPEKGKANQALETLMARWLDVPRSRVGVVAGAKSRSKTVEVAGDPEELSILMDTRLEAGA